MRGRFARGRGQVLKSEIQFGQFLPDNPDFQNPGCVKANNTYPTAGGYGPFLGLGNTSGSTSGTCRGAALFERSTGDVITAGGGDDKLWVDVSGTVTNTTGLNSIGADAYWQFEQFNSFAFAVSPNNDLQHLTAIDSDLTWSAVSDAPEQAKVIGRIGPHLVVGNLASNPYKIQWSGLNAPTVYTPDATNLAGNAEMPHQYGEVTGIVGDRFPMIFQEYGISRISAVGPPLVFQVETIEEARGAIAPNSIVTVGFMTFFLAHDGFWASNGAAPQPIGTSRVNEFFRDDASAADLFRVQGAVNWEMQSIVWAYPSKGSGGVLDKIIIYSWAQDRWSTASIPVHWLVQGTVDATTLEDLDALYASIDDVPVSLDSAMFKARGRRLSAYVENGSNTELTALDGDALQTDFEIGESQPEPGRRSVVLQVWPIVQNSTENTEARVITRSVKGGPEVVSPVGVLNEGGWCPVRAEGLYTRVRITIPAGAIWEKAQGVQIGYRGAGTR